MLQVERARVHLNGTGTGTSASWHRAAFLDVIGWRSKWDFLLIVKTEAGFLAVWTVATEMAGARQHAFCPKQGFEALQLAAKSGIETVEGGSARILSHAVVVLTEQK